jgi:thiopeptide-type bacteriocin biosynthesis protein
MEPPTTEATEQAVLAVLAGVPLEEAAASAELSSAHLAECVVRYRAAGRSALGIHPAASSGWLQFNLEFSDYAAGEQVFARHLLTPLETAAADGAVAGWWFVRKFPCWRLRVAPGNGTTVEDVSQLVVASLDAAVSAGGLTLWRPMPYEPETAAFGGPLGMRIAHHLFHVDSAGVLSDLIRRLTVGEGLLDSKATSFLAVSCFLRAAGQEWSEQGDVWDRVAAKRPLPADVSTDSIYLTAQPVRVLLSIDSDHSAPATSPLYPYRLWFHGLRNGGHLLAQAATAGQLTTGTRGLLARHVLFHWNRMGFTQRQQALWARAAREAILTV